jgi:hypothetical protein
METIGQEIDVYSGGPLAEEDKRWAAKAKEYREAIEARMAMLVTQPTLLKRGAVIRYKRHRHQRLPEEQIYMCGERQGRGIPLRLGQIVRNTKPPMLELRIVRVWIVCTINVLHDEQTFEIHNRWQRIEMAKAHRDGRNFHYAKYLMTEKEEQWTRELANR